MASRQNTQELIPSARRLITSLRDLGYDFSAAVADIIDNSIEAKAQNIAIRIQFSGDDSWVCIADDGTGMDAETLTVAMRYGADRDYSDEDLGRFGLGLKTASMSQCRRLTVASRSDGRRVSIVARQWDLERIEQTDKWQVILLNRRDCPPQVLEPLQSSIGTAVLWERLDRILGYEKPYGEAARKRLAQMTRELEMHLSMVFHRFLEGEARGRQLTITINGNRIEPWDPYARSEEFTQKLKTVRISLEHEDIKGTITLQPYILPRQSRFSSGQAFSNAAGPQKWNRQQGIYIYRADRMIQSGGWCRLRTLDEHTKLARVALSFSPKLDSAFKINVAKMRVQMPTEIRRAVEEALVPVVRAAQAEYREGGSKPNTHERRGEAGPPVSPRPATGTNGSDGSTGSTDSARPAPQMRTTWSLDEVKDQLLLLASESEREVVAKLFARLQRTLKNSKATSSREGSIR